MADRGHDKEEARNVPDLADHDCVERFYSAIADPYDRFASSQLFRGLRRRAVEALELDGDERVLEVGCGTGGNLPVLDRHLGADGHYVGIDLSDGMLRRAASRQPTVSTYLLRGDAETPPVRGPFDAILSTFVMGVLGDPGVAVERWLSLLHPDGRLVLLDAAGRRGVRSPLELGFRTFVILAAPPGTRSRRDTSANEALVSKVENAHRTLRKRGDPYHESTHWRGFVRLTGARPSR
ncbi:MAG: class I SAM-dependent methyltransferase [Halodesulfurarchaeum sp.]